MSNAPFRGRGAQSGAASTRFGLAAREADGNWLDERERLEEAPAPPRTTVTIERPKSILTYNRSPDIFFDRSVNAYRGCEHGCVYCFARPSHAFHDLSPGLDFETQLFAKPNAAALLRAELAKSAYRPKPIAMGTNTDPYQPIERDHRITRSCLAVLLEARHPVTITTKSDRVVADIDLIAELAEHRLVTVAISVTSLDPALSGKLEPRAASPAKRLAAIGKLSAAGVPVHCSLAPVIPAITDGDMETIVTRAAELGAVSVGWIPLRLPFEVAGLFREWLDVHYPERAGKVMSVVRSIRDSRDNDPSFFSRLKPRGVWAELFGARFDLACRRAGVGQRSIQSHFALDETAFRRPSTDGQMALL